MLERRKLHNVCKIEIDLIYNLHIYMLESICRWATCETRKKFIERREQRCEITIFFFLSG